MPGRHWIQIFPPLHRRDEQACKRKRRNLRAIQTDAESLEVFSKEKKVEGWQREKNSSKVLTAWIRSRNIDQVHPQCRIRADDAFQHFQANGFYSPILLRPPNNISRSKRPITLIIELDFIGA
jgi:hypothetical protein